MGLIARYVANGGGAMVVLHDIHLAARFASRLVWMKGGEIVADGAVEETLSAARMVDVFGVEAQVDGRKIEILQAL